MNKLADCLFDIIEEAVLKDKKIKGVISTQLLLKKIQISILAEAKIARCKIVIKWQELSVSFNTGNGGSTILFEVNETGTNFTSLKK